jgi:hypothetical protein
MDVECARTRTEGITMKLICASCFLTPALVCAGLPQEVSDMVVCTTPRVGYASATSLADASTLRCDYCGGKVELEHHHSTWYGC